MEKWERDYGNANPSIDDVQLALADASFAVFEANVRARPKYAYAFALTYVASLPKSPVGLRTQKRRSKALVFRKRMAAHVGGRNEGF